MRCGGTSVHFCGQQRAPALSVPLCAPARALSSFGGGGGDDGNSDTRSCSRSCSRSRSLHRCRSRFPFSPRYDLLAPTTAATNLYCTADPSTTRTIAFVYFASFLLLLLLGLPLLSKSSRQVVKSSSRQVVKSLAFYSNSSHILSHYRIYRTTLSYHTEY